MNKTVKMKHKITPAPSDSEGTGQEDSSKNADSKEKKLKESQQANRNHSANNGSEGGLDDDEAKLCDYI